MAVFRRMMPGWVRRWLDELRFPWLLLLTALALAVNVAIPDPVPFLDEIVLTLVGTLLASLRKKKAVTPPADSEDGATRTADPGPDPGSDPEK